MTPSLRANLIPFAGLGSLMAVGVFLDSNVNGYVQRIMLYVLVNVILATSLNFVSGFTGQFSMGHAGFAAVGGYLAAFLSLQPWAQELRLSLGSADLILFTCFTLAGGLLAGLVGLAVGIPSLRLRGDYLAIVTLGFGEIVRVILLNSKSVGGALGLSGLPVPSGFTLGPLSVSSNLSLFFYSSFWVVVSVTVLWRLIASSKGKVFLSVREDELATQSMGIDVTKVKVLAFVISSFFAGVAGSLGALAVGGLNPTVAAFSRSVDIIIMIVLGGLGSLSGSILAAVVVTVVPEFLLRPLQDYTGVDLRMVIYSALLILFMILRPKGLLGTSEVPDLLRRRKAQA